jgi:hypothetical protein
MNAQPRTTQDYRLDLAQGSYAVPLSAGATRLTPDRWIDVIRTGGRGGTAGAEAAVTATVLDVEPVYATELDADLVGAW